MDLNHLLSWTVGAGCLITLLQLIGRNRSRELATLVVVILCILGIGLWLFPDYAGYVAGSLYLGLLFLPGWGSVLLNRLLVQKRYRSAKILSHILSLVRPGRESLRLPSLIQAMHLIKAGGPAERISALLQKLLAPDTPTGHIALVLLTRHEGSWQKFLDWAHEPGNQRRVDTDPNLLDTYLQALGETGRREEMIVQADRLESRPGLSPGDINLIRMKAAAFCGDDFIVAQFLSGPLRELPDALKQYWRATAVQTSGRTAEAEREFQILMKQKDRGIALAALRRVEQPLPTLTEYPLSQEEQSRLHRLSFLAESQIQHGSLVFPQRRCWATWTLAAALVVVFLFEIPGGSEDPINLMHMGAMLIPPDPSGADWWRVFTAAFLHFGPLHLGMNLLGLLILGVRLERMWGPWLLLISYLMAAVGSIGFAAMIISEDNMLVGASGGVMGLLGGLVAQSFFDLIKHRGPQLIRQFATLVTVVLVQMTFDANTPEVSSEAHLLGVMIGFLSGVLWNIAWWLRSRVSRVQ